VSVLNVAKALASIRGSLKRSVVIMWFSGEEEGLLGSKYYVNNSPIIPLNKTVYMINLDMVGYMKSNGNTLAALGGGTSEVGERLLKEIGTKYQDRKISVTARAGGGSDHVPFMAKGIPGVFLHTGVSNNKSYHRTSDTAEKVDYAGMEMAAKVAFELTERVANEASLSDSLTLTDVRAPFVTEEEMQQTCHHLMQNPFVEEALDFSLGNDGR
jgi:Zn-dependent M28 family amino/carboxypeptidase